MPTSHFHPGLFSFLSDLASHNDREWFRTNRARYVEEVQEPALSFIADLAPRLSRISPHLTADARPVGGSLFRIQRDTRFSRDKSPYKTNTGMHFRHEAARDVHAPGFYLHLEPGRCFAGAGLWRPDAATAGRIRAAIVESPDEWRRTVRAKGFRETYTLEGDRLVRPPRGVDPDHPLLEDLRRKDFVASVALTDDQVTHPGFLAEYARLCRVAAPFVRFLCRALDLPF